MENNNLLFDDILKDLIDSSKDDNFYIEDAWEQAIEKYEKLWGEDLAEDLMYSVDLFVNPKISTRKDRHSALAITTPSDESRETLNVIFSTVVIDEEETDQDFEFWNILLHEMCHAAAYFTDGSLDHGATWHRFVDKLNSKCGYNIVENVD